MYILSLKNCCEVLKYSFCIFSFKLFIKNLSNLNILSPEPLTCILKYETYHRSLSSLFDEDLKFQKLLSQKSRKWQNAIRIGVGIVKYKLLLFCRSRTGQGVKLLCAMQYCDDNENDFINTNDCKVPWFRFYHKLWRFLSWSRHNSETMDKFNYFNKLQFHEYRISKDIGSSKGISWKIKMQDIYIRFDVNILQSNFSLNVKLNDFNARRSITEYDV